MRESGFSHVVITTAHESELGGFFDALGWQSQPAECHADACEFWGLGAPTDVTRWIAPSRHCEVVLLPVPESVPPLRPLNAAVTAPGGLFDINMRTWDSNWARDFLAEHGWRELVPSVHRHQQAQ